MRTLASTGHATTDGGSRHRASASMIVGLVAVLVSFIGIGALHAMQQPPFMPTDETAHVGYAQEVASWRLPEISDIAPIPIEARRWEAERSTANDIRYRGVWVANHPPLHYVAVAPLIWTSRAVGATDGGVILLRFANVAIAAVGVFFTFLLASELTRRNHRLAVLAAALAALVPQGHAVFSQALNDGMGFAVGTAMVWAGARCLRRIDTLTRRDLTLLATVAVVAFGARAATMLLAIAVVGVVAVCRFTRAAGGEQLGRSTGVVLVGLGPALVLLGWFYARNIVLYGDVGASQYLLELFRRERQGSVFAMITSWSLWSNVYEGLMSPSTRRRLMPPGGAVLTITAAVGLSVVFVSGRFSSSRQDGDVVDGSDEESESRTLRWQIALCVVAVGVIALTIAQHASGGGSAHARYMMPAIGVAAVLLVIGMERIWSRWAPLALVTVAGWWALVNLPVDVDPATLRRLRDEGQLPPFALRTLPMSDAWRTGAGVMIATGVATFVVAMLVSLRRRPCASGGGTPRSDPVATANSRWSVPGTLTTDSLEPGVECSAENEFGEAR